MSLEGLDFTLEVDSQEPDTNFRLTQSQLFPLVLSVHVGPVIFSCRRR